MLDGGRRRRRAPWRRAGERLGYAALVAAYAAMAMALPYDGPAALAAVLGGGAVVCWLADEAAWRRGR